MMSDAADINKESWELATELIGECAYLWGIPPPWPWVGPVRRSQHQWRKVAHRLHDPKWKDWPLTRYGMTDVLPQSSISDWMDRCINDQDQWPKSIDRNDRFDPNTGSFRKWRESFGLHWTDRPPKADLSLPPFLGVGMWETSKVPTSFLFVSFLWWLPSIRYSLQRGLRLIHPVRPLPEMNDTSAWHRDLWLVAMGHWLPLPGRRPSILAARGY